MSKIILFIFGLLSVFVLAIACKKDNLVDATVVRDCTGTYLRIGKKDYKVCNPELTDSFTSDQTVKVAFNMSDNCEGGGNAPFACYMNHTFHAWAQVKKIR